MDESPAQSRERSTPSAARRWIVALGTLSASLLAVCVALALRLQDGGAAVRASLQGALDDPELRAQVIEELMSRSSSIFDSHPDPEVGRVLLPRKSDMEFAGVSVESNSWGMREREYALPKPDGTVRVVLLGDSYVFGFGVEAEDRMGVFLEDYLRERATGFDGPIEVLHLAIGSWGAVSECTFVRRQLGELQPDVVVQLLVTNDLDDNAGVRGFGARSTYADRYRERADAIVTHTWPIQFSEEAIGNFLLEGVDHESRSRYEDLGEHVARLAREVERAGGHYLLASHWSHFKPKLLRHLAPRLDADQILHLPNAFWFDREYCNGPGDPHWNRRGHERFARLLFGVIRERELLPQLGLEPWPEVEQESRAFLATGHGEATGERPPRYWSTRRPVASTLDFRSLNADELSQLYGGIDDEGNVGPYGSLLLRNLPGGKLILLGRALERPELDGTRVRVFAEEAELGSFTLEAGEILKHYWDLPAEIAAREFLNVRFTADDYVYAGPRRRQCVSFQLRQVAVLLE